MLLKLTNISKSFGEKKVLENLSLELGDGERLCILGPSGGGKTTLLNIIAGLIPPDGGEITRNFSKLSYVFQEYRLLPWVTALENITAATGCTDERARELLEAVELGNEFGSYPDSLSGGMKQRVNIARALAAESDIILMDEPFKELDAGLRERIIRVADDYCGKRAVILVTHDERDCEMMHCERVLNFS